MKYVSHLGPTGDLRMARGQRQVWQRSGLVLWIVQIVQTLGDEGEIV